MYVANKLLKLPFDLESKCNVLCSTSLESKYAVPSEIPWKQAS